MAVLRPAEGTESHPDAVLARRFTLRAVTVIMASVVGLTFLFDFGNVWTLALRLNVTPWVAPLIAPAVDLSVIGLLLGTRYLALHSTSAAQLRPARRLLVFSSMITMALNVTDPLLAGQAGKAAFDAVGPLLLIGWAEVGPGLLRAIGGVDEGHMVVPAMPRCEELRVGSTVARIDEGEPEVGNSQLAPQSDSDRDISHQSPEGDLLARARYEDARHREMHQRPISAETLRKRLHVGAARSRTLVATVRSSGPD